jgi:hypothetical protein
MPIQAPTIQSVHQDAPLTNLSIAFMQEDDAFVSQKVFPRVPVSKQSDSFYTFPRETFLRSRARERAPGTRAQEVGYVPATTTYRCDRIAAIHPISDPVRDNADSALDLDRQGLALVMSGLSIELERRWVTNFFSASVWTGSSTAGDITPAVTWDDPASTPIEDIKLQKRSIVEQTGKRANTLVCGAKLFDDLVEHPDIKDVIKGAATPGNPAIANESALAQIFGVERVLVARATRDTAASGIALSMDFIAGERNALLVHAASSPGLMTPSGGYTFVWNAVGNDFGIMIERFRGDPRDESDYIQGGIWFDYQATSTVLGAFFSNAVAA